MLDWAKKDKYKKIANKYYTMDPNMRLHQTPEFAYLSYNLDACSSDRERKALGRVPSLAINATAMYLLKHADGKHTIDQVIQSYSEIKGPAKEPSKFYKMVVSFIETVVDQNSLTLHDQVMPCEVPLYGSENAWYPVSVSMEITDACNLKCKHCYRYSSDNIIVNKSNHVDTEQYIKTVNLLHDNGLINFEITGGEPLCHPEFTKLLDLALDKFNKISVMTNGSLVTPELCDHVAKYAHKITFCISLDGSCSEVHDNIRGKGAFDATVSGIRLLIARNINVRAGITLMDDNLYDFENIVQLAIDLGCWKATFNPVFPFGRGAKVNANASIKDRTEDEKNEIISILNKTKEKYSKFLGIHDVSISKKGLAGYLGNCGAGYRGVCIDPLGNVRPCLMLPTIGPVLGNIFSDNYEVLFGSEIIHKLRHLKAPDDETCDGCKRQAFCKLCSVRGMYAYENFEPDCAWAKKYNISKWFNTSTVADPYTNPEQVNSNLLDLDLDSC